LAPTLIYTLSLHDALPIFEDILAILKKLNIINSQENIQLAREFLIAGVKIDKTTFDKISTMKQNLKELISLSNEENMARLMEEGDRKSTRLNSSHVKISYA